MSLILEALRKSEAERQRGRAPGLFVEQHAPTPPGTHVPAWIVWVAGGALLLVLVAWGWREFGRSDAGDSVVPTGPPAVAAVATPGASPPMSTAPPPPIETVPVREPDAVAMVDTAADPGVGSPAPVQAPAPAAAAPTPTLASAPAPAVMPDVAPATTPAADAVAAADPALPRLADVPAAERSSLPPLKLSMHVYSDEPARRFVIVDGQRLTEGAAPAPGVVVEEIRRDGAVLSLNGRRVLVSRP